MGKIYGYCRVSTKKQSIARQKTAILAVYPDAIFVIDSGTGKNFDRPGWKKLHKIVKSGDTIVFDEVSRMSRDAEEGFATYQELYDRGVNLVFIEEPMVNSENYRTALSQQITAVGDEIADLFIEAANKAFMILAKKQIKIAFERSEGEIAYHTLRTKQALAENKKHNEQLILKYGSEEEARKDPTWKQRGQKPGAKLTTKKSIAAKEIIKKHSKDFDGTLSDPDVMKLAGIARGTYYKYKRELREE